MAFEYRYRFSLDEEIISRYNFFERAKFLFETRTTFIVKGSDGEERVIDSERYAEGAVIYSKQQMTQSMGLRFKDYFMPDETIKRLNDEVMIFVKGIEAGGRRGKIPVAVDLEVCTVQREGEGIAATADRAIRAEYLPPLYMYPLSIDYSANAVYEPRPTVRDVSLYFLLLDLARAAIRVEDVKKGLGVMEECSIC